MDRTELPERVTVRANVPLPGWPRGEVREVPVNDRLLRRAANGTVTILPTEPEPAPLVGAAAPDDPTVEIAVDPPDDVQDRAWPTFLPGPVEPDPEPTDEP
jgi:hypothetical protein